MMAIEVRREDAMLWEDMFGVKFLVDFEFLRSEVLDGVLLYTYLDHLEPQIQWWAR